jgi:hypothetical protein
VRVATKPDWRPGAREYVACYALLLVLLALSALAFFLAWDAIQWLVPVILGWDRVVAAEFTVDLATILIGGGLFVLAILAEEYLRAGVQRRDIRRRFLRLAVPLVAASVVSYLIPVALVLLSRGGRI